MLSNSGVYATANGYAYGLGDLDLMGSPEEWHEPETIKQFLDEYRRTLIHEKIQRLQAQRKATAKKESEKAVRSIEKRVKAIQKASEKQTKRYKLTTEQFAPVPKAVRHAFLESLYGPSRPKRILTKLGLDIALQKFYKQQEGKQRRIANIKVNALARTRKQILRHKRLTSNQRNVFLRH